MYDVFVRYKDGEAVHLWAGESFAAACLRAKILSDLLAAEADVYQEKNMQWTWLRTYRGGKVHTA